MGSARSRERVAHNFIERYGRDRFKELLDLLAEGASGQVIAEAFEVSRERVRQWKNTFGTVVTLYQVHPEVAALLEPKAPRAAR
ncbi:MAG: hypothetical protein ABMA64_00115 [Myxococcota bacterium]